MTVFYREMRYGVRTLCVWSSVLAFLLLTCIFMFPQMAGEMESVGQMFSDMGSFTAAFGMDRINFGELIGFYGIECGSIIGIGGGFFAAFLGVTMLAKEEKERTAEFLLTQGAGRRSVFLQKLLAVIVQLTAFNLFATAVSAASIASIGESIAAQTFLQLHAGFYLLQVEIACICFGFSAFLRRGGIGLGIGFAALLYFANLIRNIGQQAAGLKYVTPYAYADAADIISNGAFDWMLVLLHAGYVAIVLVAGGIYYTKKDISC